MGGLGVGGRLVAGVVVLLVLRLWLVLLQLVLVVGGVGRSSVSWGGGGIGRSHISRSMSGSGVGLDHSGSGSRSMMVLYRGSCHHFVVHMGQWLTVDDGVESVDGIGRVLHSPAETIGIIQRVLALDDIPITGLHLALGIAGEGILDIVGEVVLGMRVIGVHLVGMSVAMDVVGLLVDHVLRLVGLVLLVLLQGDETRGGGGQEAGDYSNQLGK